jgi:two-component system sensor histidine kinase KdpD
MNSHENRPSPEALLEEAKGEHRGKLKIFLGAAPGVGKTYAMLGAAKSRLAEGIDTVIGVVETHQRSETEALAQGIELITRQTLDYRGLGFEEMDLDAILKRKAKLVLVDELAHTNIPGARHPKRYQDVLEILEAGIDVYSTLNIQHIESLNDIVARITGVTVRETVPDTIMQMANSIELIDLPPDELLQRLKDGKVYIPEQARLAVNRFFTPGNLTALRELALRQAAERVDDQMVSYMRRHAISGPWPTASRIMVCISDDRQAASLVRTARRSAERRQSPWLVLYIETSRHSLLPDAARNDIALAMELAESMGAEIMTVTAEDIASEILRIARERNISTIIIGKSIRSAWSRLTRPSVAAAVLDRGDGFDIMLMNNAEARRSGPEARRASAGESAHWSPDWPGYRKATSVVAMASVVAWAIGHMTGGLYLPYIFTIAILLLVLDMGFEMSAFATILCGVSLNLLMQAPHFSLLPATTEQCISLLFFLATGLTISLIGDYLHRQINITRRNAERTHSLFDFTKSIAAAATIDDVAQVTVRRVAMTLNARVALLLPRNERLEIAAAMPADLRLDTASDAAMDWAWHHGKPAGFRSNTLPGASFYGLPLQIGSANVGVLALRVEDGSALSVDQSSFLSSLVYQAASAIERARLVGDVAQARLQTETEKLRASFLSSISHDLRTPLDSIIVTARNLNNGWDNIATAEKHRLVGSIEAESDSLDRFVQNLLDMTELVTGNMRLVRKSINIRVLIGEALARLSRQIGSRPMRFDCADNLPIVEGDEDTLRRVFVNVIENACKYSPPEEMVTIAARLEGVDVKVTVSDRGPGIPQDERQRVFDMFYRIKNGVIGGAGLGLSICRGFVEAHGGNIAAHPGEDNIGTMIVVRLPGTIEPDTLTLL